MRLFSTVAVAAFAFAVGAQAAPQLTRSPSLSADAIAFLHGDDIWITSRDGGAARPLTTGGLARGGPVFSPDGQQIAYAAQAGAGMDIFVVSASGGEPRRLTWHPDAETVSGWSPDSKAVIAASARASALRGSTRLFRIAADGQGTPEALPLPTASAGSLSPDGTRIAYTPFSSRGWKGYRGGRAPYIWLADLTSLDIVKVPHTEASDWNPMWVDGQVYFLSDRDGPVSLYAFDEASGAVTRVLENTGAFDFQSAQAGPAGIVVDAFDSLKLFDPATGKARTLTVKIPQAPGLGARKVDLPGRRATHRALSPDGKTYALEARGDVFLAPATGGGSARNLTDTPAIAERSPTWSPDGKQLAYLSDASGEARLVIHSADGAGKPRILSLGQGRGDFTNLIWSPDGARMSYVDETTAIWVLDLATGKSVRVGHDIFGQGSGVADWAADGQSLAYVTRNRALTGVLHLVDARTGKAVPVTDGRADVFAAAFDPAGGKLYFLASPDRQMATTASMASNGVPYTAQAYAFDLADRTIQRLAAPAKQYTGLSAKEPGGLVLTDSQNNRWRLADGKTEPAPKAEAKPFEPPALPMTVNPRAEWTQIWREAWRQQRDLFYAGHFNGLDMAKAEAKYTPFVAGLNSRLDLTYLMREAFSELRVSHMGVTDPPAGDPGLGAAAPEAKTAGLLGADYVVEGGRYRFQRIYAGDVWSTDAAPLAGVGVKAGDYLLAVAGQEVRAGDNLDRAFEGMAGKPVEIRVADDASGAGARTYTVTPAANEFAWRHAAWIADNRRKVDELSGGKLAYVYVINTADEGYNGFNAQYLPQVDKAGVIVDERNNGGGPIADFIVERLKRQPLVQVWPRHGEIGQPFPADFIDGPAAMIVNENAGSGGDILPHMFKKAKAGPIVGKRTWGGTIGAGPSPTLLDGGRLSIPHFPISDPDGTWGGLEGAGVTPDIEVEQEPKLVAAGRDPQLEAAVKAVMDQIAAHPCPDRRPPPSREGVRGGRAG